VHVLGIRHHGPGSARALQRALDALEPDAILVELPADTQGMLRWAARDDLVPPVAVLGYVPTDPATAVFLPLAEFSPEWIAMRHAARTGVPIQAIDMALRLVLAPGGDAQLALDGEPTTDPSSAAARLRPRDPIAELAAAAGDDDPERWWDDVIEHRHVTGGPRDVTAPVASAVTEALAPFTAIAAAMGALRGPDAHDRFEARREATMRQGIRAALAAGHRTVAVVCGAWHVPALAGPLPPATADARLLRGMPKVKVDVAWVPWSHQRLAAATGYGAGVGSPAWYAHVFAAPEADRIERWFVAAAGVLRANGHDASPDHLISATRLAGVLAGLRKRPQPGLSEVLDALTAVLGEGGAVPMALVHDELVVGRAIGDVPPDAPMVPLARDLAVRQRRLRMKPTTGATRLELDLRTPLGRNRSHLLHRMRALDIPWAELDDWRGSSGTFREMWVLHWRPELAVPLVERAAYGTTVEAAAGAYLADRAQRAGLAELVQMLDIALAADLGAAVAALVEALAGLVAQATDIADVIDTLTPLARAVRYGDVRGSDLSALSDVFDALVVHVLAGLGLACRSLDPDAAAAMAARLGAAQAALALVEHPARTDAWPRELLAVAAHPAVPAIVRGRAVRLARDAGRLTPDDAGRWMSRALSPAVAPADAAAFVEGFLAGSGTLLGHDLGLLALVDGWVSSLSNESFETTIPLLRRTFAEFEPAERRRIGDAVSGQAAAAPVVFGIDPERAAHALVTIRAMLGATVP
jgi:hypothetical protein